MDASHLANEQRADSSREGQSLALLERQSAILDFIASGAPLLEILEAIVRLVEEHTGDMRCAILLADGPQETLSFAMAPHIPDDYRRHIEPFLKVAPDMGACGTAAYRREPVYTQDTATDPLWERCGTVAVRNGLRAVWSSPILAQGVLLGTFAMYYGQPRLPSEEHVQLISMAVQMARLAIESREAGGLAALHERRAGMVITDLVGRMLWLSRPFADKLGYAVEDLRNRNIGIVADDDHDALMSRLLSNGGDLYVHRRYRARNGDAWILREHWTLQRDASGKARSAVGRVLRALEAAQHPLGDLSLRERQVLELVTAGCTSVKIAERLGISAATVNTYRSRIMAKLRMPNLPALVRFALENDVASPSTELPRERATGRDG